MQEPAIFYQAKYIEYLIRIKSAERTIRWLAFGRLICFLLILAALYFFSIKGNEWFPVLISLIAAFIILLRFSFVSRSGKNLAEQLLFINKNELEVLRRLPNGFSNGEGITPDSVFASDLDIFGPGSLFHFLNRTTTADGRGRLAFILNNPFKDPTVITDHQEAIRQISGQTHIRQMITAAGLLQNKKEESMEEITNWISTPGKLYTKKWLNIVRFILPVINIVAFLYYLDTDNPIPLGVGIAASWLLIGIFGKYIHLQHAMIGRKQSILNQYASILEQFNKADPGKSILLKQLLNSSSAGYREIAALSRLTGLLDQRMNLLVNFFLNSLLVYDIHCLIALEKWKYKNKIRFREWIGGVGEIEMLNSFAFLAFNHPGYCYPEVVHGEPFLQARLLAHPLIPEKEAVPNHFTAGNENKILLITGSNMSGKSTFLRTVGVNLLLAQCGAPVCAGEFVFSPMRILSSIRISDSLQDHTSYFMAELKRLKEIIAVLETGEHSMVLIDEVLRGTNSNDKTHGSAALISRLTRYPCLSLFATHDLSLSDLEKTYPAAVSNYCFESTIENGELLFDYTLRKGVAGNKNATFLMQKMGII